MLEGRSLIDADRQRRLDSRAPSYHYRLRSTRLFPITALDRSERTRDWTQRPLTDSLVAYAALDAEVRFSCTATSSWGSKRRSEACADPEQDDTVRAPTAASSVCDAIALDRPACSDSQVRVQWDIPRVPFLNPKTRSDPARACGSVRVEKLTTSTCSS